MFIRSRSNNRIIYGERAVGDVARGINVEWGRTTETVFPFDDGLHVGGYSMRCILRYFRGRIAERRACRRPAHLAVTGRPALLDLLSRFLKDDARKAGFRTCTLVEEYVCLAAAVGAGQSVPLLLVDVGHTGTQVYGCRGSAPLAEAFADVKVGGKQMAEAIISEMRDRHGLDIGTATATLLLAGMSDPQAWPRRIVGRDRATCLPRSCELHRNEITAVLLPSYNTIAHACHGALSKIESDPAHGVRVVLAGGAARAEGFLDLLTDRLRMRVELAPDPGECSARGLMLLRQAGKPCPSQLD